MPEAARQFDPIGHSLAGAGLIAGALAGAAIGAAIVATGGAAALAIAGAAATGASLGGTLGQMAGTFAPPVIRTGVITGPCSTDVWLNNRPAARVGDLDMCSGYPCMPGPPHPFVPVAMGSAQIFINGKPAARIGDKISCAAKIDGGSANIIFGGGQAQYGKVAGEVPWQAEVALTILGLCGPVGLAAKGLRLTTAISTGAGFFAGEALTEVGDVVGGTIFEEGSFGHYATMMAFGFVGELVGESSVERRMIQVPRVNLTAGVKKVPNPGGRKGSPQTRKHVDDIIKDLRRRGFDVKNGGTNLHEEYLPGPGGGRKGSSYPDITAEKNGRVIRINTVDVLKDGKTPTARERRNAERIRRQRPDDKLILIPKRRKGW